MSSNGHPLDAVLFDLDGTLADTIPLIVASFNAAVSPVAGRTFTLAEVISRFGPPDTAMIRKEVPDTHADVAVETYYRFYQERHGEQVMVFEGIREMLGALRGRNMPMGVMTGKGRRSADITLRELGWETFFPAVITGDETPRPKPNPDGLLEVAKLLGARPERCAYVGDSPADIKAGKAAGMRTIVAGWHSVYLDRLRPLNPDAWANHPSDVVGMCG